jgi:PilZ domain
VAEGQRTGERDAVRTSVRFPIALALHLKTDQGEFEAVTKNISANGLLFVANFLPEVGSRIEFTMAMPSALMGWEKDVSVHCMGRIVRHQREGAESMAAAVIDEYFLKA